MTAAGKPFSFPDTLSPPLQRVASYWEGLKRADNSMPFWDDLALSALQDQAARLLLVDVFADPERFRINTMGAAAAGSPAAALRGKFIDEMALTGRLANLRAQASATVAARAPTFDRGDGYARILLPMWGDGHIGMLLGAVEPQ
jgi:hypothetical protein